VSNKILLAFAIVGSVGCVWAQQVISAHSGVIQYVEGQVAVDGTAVQPRFAQFPDVKGGQTLSADDGRAEVLLTPGVFLRLAENSSFRMVSNRLADTRVEILSGTALVEVGELLANNAITVLFKDSEISLAKTGLYRIDAEPGTLRVYQGEARVTSGSRILVVKRGREVEFNQGLAELSFDPKDTDAFYRWSERRDEYVAAANITAAKTAGEQGYSGMSYAGVGSGYGNWAWNPYFGMFTFLPSSGVYFSPFGSPYFSPAMVGYAYLNAPLRTLSLGSPLAAANTAPRSFVAAPLGSSSGASSPAAPLGSSGGQMSRAAAISPSMGRGSSRGR